MMLYDDRPTSAPDATGRGLRCLTASPGARGDRVALTCAWSRLTVPGSPCLWAGDNHRQGSPRGRRR